MEISENLKRQLFEAILPVTLFYLMSFIEQFVRLDSYVGLESEKVVKLFAFVITGTLISGILYPFVKKIARKNRYLAKNIFYTLNYPVEYFFVSIMLFVFSATNLDPAVKSAFFIPALLTLSSFLQVFIRESIYTKQKDIRQEVVQEEAIRDISLFILILISVMIFVKRV